MTTSVPIILVIGQLVLTPIGVVFKAEQSMTIPDLEECWSAAVRISHEMSTPQIAFCAPMAPSSQEKDKEEALSQ